MIAKLRVERAATQTPAIPTQVKDAEVSTTGDKHTTDSMASQDGDTDSVDTAIRPTAKDEHMELDSATAHSTKEEDDPETEDASQKEQPSVNTVQKEVSATPSKPTYLDGVLQGKFNSFHVLGEHREVIMRIEPINTTDDTSQDIFQRTGSKDCYLQCISMQYGSTDEV